MAYVDVLPRTEETPVEAYTRRRAELSQGWKFACACTKCEEDRNALGLGSSEDTEMSDGSKVDRALEAHNLA